MNRDEVIETMLCEEPLRIFRTMQLGGNSRQLQSMEDEGLISSEPRYGGRHRQRNWYLTDVQWYRHHDNVHGRSTVARESDSDMPSLL